MSKPLILLGAGGHAKVVVDVIESSTDIKIIGVLDAFKSDGKFLGYPILGADDELLKFSPKEVDIFVSLGFIKSAKKRNELIDLAKSRGFSSPNIISRDKQGNETWTYDRISRQSVSGSTAGIGVGGIFGWLFGVSKSTSSSSSSSKSITVIITFDDNKSVIDFAYQSLEF